jgi:hypothetical protein
MKIHLIHFEFTYYENRRISLSQVCVYFCTSDACRSFHFFLVLVASAVDIDGPCDDDGPCDGPNPNTVFLFLLADACRNY